MNSLQQLNAFSNEQLTYTDDRPLSVTATTDGLPTTNVAIGESVAVDFSNFGVTITDITAADAATSDHLTLTFDFSAATAPTVTWPTAPNNVVFSQPTTGVFVASQIQFLADYEFILDTVEIFAATQTANFSYTVSVSWPGTTYTQQFDATMLGAQGVNLTVARSFTENTTQTDLFDISGSAAAVPSVIDYVGQDLKLVLTTTNVTPAPTVVMQPSRLIAPGASYPYATSIEKSGTATQINSWLSAQQIGFIPESGESADHTVNWEIQRLSDSVVLDSGSFTVEGTARTTALASEGTYTYNWNGVDPYFELDITEEMRLYCKADILLAGGGGAGGQRASQNPSPSAGGDGGSGGVAYAQDAYLFSVTDAQVPGGYGTENSPKFRISVGRGGYTTSNTGEVGGDTSVYYYANANWNNRLIAGIGGGGGGGGGFASTAELNGGSGAYGGGGGGVVNGTTLTLGQGGSHVLQPGSTYLGNFFGENLIKERYTNNIYIRTEGGGSGPGYGFSDQGRAGTGPSWTTRGPDATTETYGTTDYAGPGRYDATWSGYTPGYTNSITGTSVTYGDNGGQYSQGDADGNRTAVSPTNGGNGTAVIKVKAA